MAGFLSTIILAVATLLLGIAMGVCAVLVYWWIKLSRIKNRVPDELKGGYYEKRKDLKKEIKRQKREAKRLRKEQRRYERRGYPIPDSRAVSSNPPKQWPVQVQPTQPIIQDKPKPRRDKQDSEFTWPEFK